MYAVIKIAFFYAAAIVGAMLVGAAPLNSRQIGDVQCNVNRLLIVGDLGGLKNTLSTLSKQVTDPTSNAAVQEAATDVSGAQSAIGVIAAALLTGQDAPAAARDQVAGNLTSAQSALSSVTTSDSAAASTLQKAQTQLTDAINAGEGVVNDCN
ncbi:hypothetical protein CERSUDRAFT_83818 [Gelatoporia subvermispora B]|uniref:Uncharacterized protein n=1 Tax=Ceriporiopsis subvermispora (strain B) TaxID=914234 RepID=M2PKI4_CERS8|nr:hypothetical protein CERSUDRAFT_83818 [Gelatoporia subvermispora B]